MKKNVLLIYGGESVEHDISIITALQASQNLGEIYKVIPVYIGRNGVWQLADNLTDAKVYGNFDRRAKNVRHATLVMGKPYLAIRKGKRYSKFIPVDFALLCTHGKFGEDGALQGVLESCHIPYSSANYKSSALCMDKIFMKDIFISRCIPCVESVAVDLKEYKENSKKVLSEVEKLKFPVIIKPSCLGSSIGIKVCHNKEEFDDAINFSFQFDRRVLVEKYVKNMTEFNCACVHMNGEEKVSSVEEVKKEDEIFSFEEKYLNGGAKKSQKIDKNLAVKIKNLTEKIYKIFDLYGVVRVDYIFDNDKNKLYVNEINSIPGSLAFYLFKDLSFKDLLNILIEEGLERVKNEHYISAYDSEALDVFEKLNLTYKNK